MSFEEFWKVYPKKVGIGNARGQWPWAINKAPAEQIIRGAMEYAKHCRGTDWQYVLSPAKWLIGEHWSDIYSSPGLEADPDLELKAQAKVIAKGDKFALEYRDRLPRQRIEEMVSKGYLTKAQAGRTV